VSERVIRHVVISGRVQGVGYRDWTRHVARSRGIEGWVRNRNDGAVEAIFAGSQDAVAGMLAACKNGPPSSSVESVEDREATEAELDLRGEKTFPILRTV
jgi:acylphosphatase